VAIIRPVHPDPKGGVPGEVVFPYIDGIAIIQSHTIILEAHIVVVNLCMVRFIHHHPSPEGLTVVGPDINPTCRINFVVRKVILMYDDGIRIGDINRIVK
jgi:hypothetical protein